MTTRIMSHSRVSSLSPGRIALGYAVIAILWIAFSDAVVTYFKLYPAVMTIKGTVFVLVTASLLYFTIRRLVQAVQLTSRERDETAELYRTVVEASNEGVCLLDESGRISFLNGRLAAMLGHPAEELQGKCLQNFIEEPNVLAQPGAQHSETRECRLRMDSDPKPWVLISRRPMLNDAGDTVGLVVTVIDISERKRSEKALRRSEAYLADVPGAQESLKTSQSASPARYGLAILSVGVALAAALFLQYLHFRDVAIPLLLLAVAISSWSGGIGPAVLATILSTISFYWYFIEPVRTIYIYWSNIPYFIIFVAFAALITWFGTVRRRVEAGLREQAALLNLTHDTVFMMDMEGVIKYWNRGAEERYGWTAEQVVGKVAYELLKTVLPAPFEEIKAEMTRTGRWEGELLHTNKHGTQLVVASRWALQRDRRGAPFAIMETNNDISERKRAEDALSRLNRELRAISDCNQVLLRATEEQSLLDKICRIVCEQAGYRMAWVAYAEHNEAKSVRPVAWSGTDAGYLASAAVTWADTERGRGHTGTAIRSGKTCCIQDFVTDPRVAPWREGLLQRGFRSGIALPLKDEDGNAFGSLTIHSAQADALGSEEVRLLEELAGDMAFGIVTLRSRAARKQAEQEVSLLSFALNNIREAALLIDERACFQYVNDEACRVLGYTRAELLGTSVSDIDPEFPAGRWSDHWRDLKAQRSLNFESRHRTRDGRIFPVEISANYFEYRDRAYNLALVRDISERKQAEEALRQSEANLNRAQEIAHVGSWHLDITHNRLDWSDEVFRIFGVPLGAQLTYEAFLSMVHPADRKSVDKAWSAALHGAPYDIEHRIIVGGDVKWVREQAQLEFSKEGNATGGIGTVQDISERKLAEESLRRSETYLAEAERINHTGSWAWNPASTIQYWSQECYRIMGFDPAKGVPRLEQFLQAVHPEDLPAVRERLRRVTAEKTDYEVEYRIIRPNGEVRDLRVIGRPVFDSAGNLVEYVGTTGDVTERKQAEETVRRTAAYLAETQRLTRTGTYVTDHTTKPVYWSEELFRIFGFDPQRGLPTGEQVLERLHPEDRDNFIRAFRRAVDEKVNAEVEYRIILPDGRLKNIYGIGHPVLNANGEVVEVVGTTVDITERKRADEALRESETRFRTFVDHAGDALFICDLERGSIVDVNRSACEELGYTREELIGKTPGAFHLDSYETEMESTPDRAAAGDTRFDTHLHRRKDGSTFPVEVHANPVSYGGRRYLLMVARDVSDRVRAEEQRERLRQLEAELAHLDRLTVLGELTASIAHEVNQPLSGIVSNASACLRFLAGDSPDLEEVREATRDIVRDGKRAGEVIARIRALTRKASTPREKLDLNETLRQVLALVRDEAQRKGVNIRAEFADDLPPVLGDQVQLQQVVLNLAMNAIEAMSSVAGRPRQLIISTENIDAKQVQVKVEDSGMGLDLNTMQKIFEPFYTTKPTGMGLGLSISRSIVQSHGGRLWATAKEGSGTIFYFTLLTYHEEESHARVPAN